MIVYTCPKCGHALLHTTICTLPPIHVDECPACGWRHESTERIEYEQFKETLETEKLLVQEPICKDCVHMRDLKMWPKYQETRHCCVMFETTEPPATIYEVQPNEIGCEAFSPKEKKEGNHMIKVYGESDDLVEIEGSKYTEDEIGCYKSDVIIIFTDGTEIRVGYPKQPGLGVWGINVETKGTAEQKLTECFDEDAEVYSDIFEIDAEVKTHMLIEHEG